MGIASGDRGSGTPGPGPLERACVLLVDDDGALRRSLAKRLRRQGHAVVEADNGAEALEALGLHAVDVVVCDIRMPDMDGMTLLERVREGSPDIPVVLLTGAPDMASAVRAVGSGAFQYLTKPADLPRLGDCVDKAVEAHRLATSRRQILESAQHRITRGIESADGADDAISEGTVLAGRYRVGALLGTGGMGTVYEGRREDLADMPVAIKVLHPRLTERKDILVRFRREAEVVAAIDHPNIVKVLDFVTLPGGQTFLVMELLRGRTLAQAIREDSPIAEQRVAFIASQVLGALAAAHDVNVVHRDLKPENLLLTTLAGIRDLVKLLDFGIAKLVAVPEDHRLTETGTVLGTPAYMAPEYTRGEAASASGDIYAVGCVMYEALVGELPFGGANYHAMLHAIQEASPRPIASARPDVSTSLIGIVERAMAKDPAGRFPTARAMAEALSPWVAIHASVRSASPLSVAPTVELDVAAANGETLDRRSSP